MAAEATTETTEYRSTLPPRWERAQIATILDTKTAAMVDGVLVDTFTAQALLTIIDTLSEEYAKGMQSLTMKTAAEWAWRKIKEGQAS